MWSGDRPFDRILSFCLEQKSVSFRGVGVVQAASVLYIFKLCVLDVWRRIYVRPLPGTIAREINAKNM